MIPINCPLHTSKKIGCVTETIEKGKGTVYMNNKKRRAYAKEVIKKGQWVKIIRKEGEYLHVTKINVQLASCCC